jgi:protein-S-isoprenylcysteine O-methyltransferase Ste14
MMNGYSECDFVESLGDKSTFWLGAFQMVESIGVTMFPVLFLITLTLGDKLLRRRESDAGDKPSIDKKLFLMSKFSILLLWAAMILQSWGINLFVFEIPQLIHWISISLWIIGFTLLFMGRFGLGTSFRVGTPQERTILKVDGIYRFSRNPMYLGLYATFLASFLYTLNPVVCFIGIFVALTHHKIILAEEKYLQETFGQEYKIYRGYVRRYI